MKDLPVNDLERRILMASNDLATTKKRIKMIVVTAIACIVAFWVLGAYLRSIEAILAVGTLYVVITLIEKISYGKAVIAYKGLIQKLVKRIEELEAAQNDRHATRPRPDLHPPSPQYPSTPVRNPG